MAIYGKNGFDGHGVHSFYGNTVNIADEQAVPVIFLSGV